MNEEKRDTKVEDAVEQTRRGGVTMPVAAGNNGLSSLPTINAAKGPPSVSSRSSAPLYTGFEIFSRLARQWDLLTARRIYCCPVRRN